MEHSIVPVELDWVFGISSDVRNGVIDLRTPDSNNIAYVAGHTIVAYDHLQHVQVFLQGHVHDIKCVAVGPKKKYIASADCGPDAMLIVWDATTFKVHSSVPLKETKGIVAVDFFRGVDGFVTLSAVGRERQQKVCVWSILPNSCEMIASASVFPTDPQICIHINTNNEVEFVTNGKDTVYFWKVFENYLGESDKPTIKREQGVLRPLEGQPAICELTLSIFVPRSDIPITAMVTGEIIVWQEPRTPFEKEGPKPVKDKKASSARRMHAVKIVRLHHSAITHLSVYNDYIVTGGVDGYVRFYDSGLGLVGWFEELQAGGITSISFSGLNNFYKDPTALTVQAPPFIVGTEKGHTILLQGSLFEETPGSMACKGETIVDCLPKLIKSISNHPFLPKVAMISANGILQVHDHITRRICTQREFFKLKAEVIAYSPSGSVIACGFVNGLLKIIESDMLQDIESIAISRSTIHRLEFCSDGTFLAVADTSFAVSLLKCSYSKDPADDKWEYVGKFRSHAKLVVGLHFAEETDGIDRLFSVGHDSMIVEYDLLGSAKEKRLKLKGSWPIKSSGLPTAIISTNVFRKGEMHLIISDTNFKIRIYDTKNFTCLKTFLGPTFETPIKSMFHLSHGDYFKDYLAFATEEQILGVMVIPTEKNKNIQFVGFIGHAGPIREMTLSHDRKFILTLGVNDRTINLWRVSLRLSERYFEKEMNPVTIHFTGSHGARSLQIIKEFFFTCQIHSQGEGFAGDRVIDDTIDIDELHNLLSALGLYPSRHELQEILTEIRSPGRRCVSFADFLPVFINHKPVTDLDSMIIQHAFNALGSDSRAGRLNMDALLNVLQTEGEQMSRDELHHCFETILNKDINLDALPREVTATWFAYELMNM